MLISRGLTHPQQLHVKESHKELRLWTDHIVRVKQNLAATDMSLV
jgi:hypothetical protein